AAGGRRWCPDRSRSSCWGTERGERAGRPLGRRFSTQLYIAPAHYRHLSCSHFLDSIEDQWSPAVPGDKHAASTLSDYDEGSKLKRRADMVVSTLRRYVEAMGGRLAIVATVPDCQCRATPIAGLPTARPSPLVSPANSSRRRPSPSARRSRC